ncbi:hypothetical protein GUITHDRAFT_117055 [Guillardia theta CCMP2712]|uniref:Transmembrane protein n=1 Tax=Guillardia theta (strain CCMP2712) TaxID=905079 RepID=L1IKV5_GUITC|nr:hypothetical protein GUITHDRAFT_117055 [Guillardia theta CCMP2712]EKX36757.1 hypothetical protein GUITHDRAFT_117055 [Guillardia theta CCMP2712]|eukprot:XP_005823737.1 hypothetical protein GUITHDRAFT_117055 [Guillardia theta CCMP2712]
MAREKALAPATSTMSQESKVDRVATTTEVRVVEEEVDETGVTIRISRRGDVELDETLLTDSDEDKERRSEEDERWSRAPWLHGSATLTQFVKPTTKARANLQPAPPPELKDVETSDELDISQDLAEQEDRNTRLQRHSRIWSVQDELGFLEEQERPPAISFLRPSTARQVASLILFVAMSMLLSLALFLSAIWFLINQRGEEKYSFFCIAGILISVTFPLISISMHCHVMQWKSSMQGFNLLVLAMIPIYHLEIIIGTFVPSFIRFLEVISGACEAICYASFLSLTLPAMRIRFSVRERKNHDIERLPYDPLSQLPIAWYLSALWPLIRLASVLYAAVKQRKYEIVHLLPMLSSVCLLITTFSFVLQNQQVLQLLPCTARVVPKGASLLALILLSSINRDGLFTLTHFKMFPVSAGEDEATGWSKRYLLVQSVVCLVTVYPLAASFSYMDFLALDRVPQQRPKRTQRQRLRRRSSLIR